MHNNKKWTEFYLLIKVCILLIGLGAFIGFIFTLFEELRIYGLVVDSDGIPVNGATVIAYLDGKEIGRATTHDVTAKPLSNFAIKTKETAGMHSSLPGTPLEEVISNEIKINQLYTIYLDNGHSRLEIYSYYGANQIDQIPWTSISPATATEKSLWQIILLGQVMSTIASFLSDIVAGQLEIKTQKRLITAIFVFILFSTISILIATFTK